MKLFPFLRRVIFPLVAALTLAPAIVLAAPISSLLRAHEAYQNNELDKLERLAQSMPPGPLQWYPTYWLAQKALELQDDSKVLHFLAVADEGYMAETIRRKWLKQLGKREDWERFSQQWPQLPPEAQDEELQCYHHLSLFQQQGQVPDKLDYFSESQPVSEGCNRLIKQLASAGVMTDDWLWKRIRLLLAGNYLTVAKQLIEGAGLTSTSFIHPQFAMPATQMGQEMMVYVLLAKAKKDLYAAAKELNRIEPQLSQAQLGFAWGQLAWLSARRLNSQQSLAWFKRSDREQLTLQQWEWWARSALRQQQWKTLDTVIRAMPIEVANRPAWLYWQARALKAMNRLPEANSLLLEASRGHHYYALLALEELGGGVSKAADKRRPDKGEVAIMAKDSAVRRALALFELSQDYNRWDFRKDAQNEWRWSMRGRTDMELLAAAELARRVGFYDMAIYSADRTQKDHDFALRYLTPYQNITKEYASKLNIDDSWVYGLIRQESRFIPVARSTVGAAGLMQLMPTTARWAARKMGLGGNIAIDDIKTNIQLGTWYLKYVLDSLAGSPVLATAAYNAGPGRARTWQHSTALEGAIYVETIPFNETRDYVQKVMANAAWYASNMGHARILLKERLGFIPAR